MRHVYGQGLVLTAVKFGVLAVGYFTALLFTLLGTILATALAA